MGLPKILKGILKKTLLLILTAYSTTAILIIAETHLSTSINAEAASIKADKVVVIKNKRAMLFLSNGKIFRAYRVSLGQNPVGHKIQYGDKRTPEGRYYLDAKNPNSNFHLSIRISYPNQLDIANARRLGVPPGHSIMIHGLSAEKAMFGKLHRYIDWTDGCIAVTNEEMEEIWQLIEIGTPIKIKP